MSLLNAYLSNADNKYRFIANCYRDDLKPGDKVVVDARVREHTYRRYYGIVRYLAYNGYECDSYVLRKLEEIPGDEFDAPSSGDAKFCDRYSFSGGNLEAHLLDSVMFKGILNHYHFYQALVAQGWKLIQFPTIGAKYLPDKHGVFHLNNNFGTAVLYILNKDDIGLQIFPSVISSAAIPLSMDGSQAAKTVVHSLCNAGFNLFEGLLRFSDDFKLNKTDLSKYMVPQGQAGLREALLSDLNRRIAAVRNGTAAPTPSPEDKGKFKRDSWVTVKTWSLPQSMMNPDSVNVSEACNDFEFPALDSGDRAMSELYSELQSGHGDETYLSDGMWLTENGLVVDRGR